MSLDTQLQRTVGTVYGELMRDSGISLVNGSYVSAPVFISELTVNGIGSPAIRRKMAEKLRTSVFYGSRDNIWTGVQRVEKCPSVRPIYTFNPWKEIMEGHLLGYSFTPAPNNAFEAIRSSPREGVSRVRDLYVLFTKLPLTLQEDFFGMLKYYPCSLEFAIDRSDRSIPIPEDVSRITQDIVARIINATEPDNRREMNYILNLLAEHNICVGKRELIRGEIESLAGYDVSRIPVTWEHGHLDERAITRKREELNEMLNRKKGRVSQTESN